MTRLHVPLVRCADHAGDLGKERLIVGDFASYTVSDDMDPPVPTQLNVTQRDDGRMQFVSTRRGIGKDNAQDPFDLTDVQKARMRPAQSGQK